MLLNISGLLDMASERLKDGLKVGVDRAVARLSTVGGQRGGKRNFLILEKFAKILEFLIKQI